MGRLAGRAWLWASGIATAIIITVGGALILDAVRDDDERQPARLEIVDARIEEDADGQPFLDVLVRNSGEEEAVVTQAVFEIARHSFVIAAGQLPSSADYAAEFPTFEEAVGAVVEVNVAQLVNAVGGGAADRFAIRIGVPAGGAGGLHSYDFDLRLRYNVELEVARPGLSVRVESR